MSTWAQPGRLRRPGRGLKTEKKFSHQPIQQNASHTEFRTPASQLVEPPTADPHGGWCGGWELETPGYPIRPRSGELLGRQTSHRLLYVRVQFRCDTHTLCM